MSPVSYFKVAYRAHFYIDTTIEDIFRVIGQKVLLKSLKLLDFTDSNELLSF